MRDIEEMLTLDERSSADFILSLRKRWADTVYPAFIDEFNNSGKKISTPQEGEIVLKSMALYPWFSHLERIGQKMMWRLGSDVVFRCSDELLDQLNSASKKGAAGLELDPALELPHYYTETDIHMQPGSFYSNDLSGYVYQFGARIVMLRDNDGYKFHKLFAQTALPDLPAKPRVVDIACGFGKSTRPLVSRYPDAEVIGVDLAEGPGVDLVSHTEKVDFPENSFDVAVSAECFEHNPYWLETFVNMHRIAKDFVVFTCAGEGRPEHGTRKSYPDTSPFTLDWDYYKNLTQEDFENRLYLTDMFSKHEFIYNPNSQDLYFWGTKRKTRKNK